MKLLKYICGLFLAAVGVVLFEAALPLGRHALPAMVMFILLALGGVALLCSFFLLRRDRSEIPPEYCPRCKSTESAPAGVLRRRNDGWVSHLVGWFAGAVWGSSKKAQVRCLQCDKLYFIETESNRFARIVFWVFIGLVVLGWVMTMVMRS